MKLLVIFPYIPWPLDRGTYQRTFHLLKSLAKQHEVDFLALTDLDEPLDERKKVFAEFCNEVEFVRFQHSKWQRLFPSRLLNPLPSNVQHWQQPHIKKVVDQRLKPGRYDLVHICDLVLMPYVLGHKDHTPFVVDRTRVDLQFQLTEIKTLHLNLKEKFLRWEAILKLWFYEKKLAKQCLTEVVCGPDDETFIRKHISKKAPVFVVPNGVNLEYFDPEISNEPRSEKPTIIFCGAMDYTPNVDALDWFFAEIYSGLMKAIPEVEILIVGKNPVDQVKSYASKKGVIVTGGVPDVRPFYKKAWIQMVPLRIGGGTRLKIVESLSIGTPVVSTRIGAQGLDLKHSKDVLFADTAAEFVKQISVILRDSELRHSIEIEGKRTAVDHFGWDAIGDRLATHYHHILGEEE